MVAVSKAQNQRPSPECAKGGPRAENLTSGLLDIMLAFHVPKGKDRSAGLFNIIKDNFYWLSP